MEEVDPRGEADQTDGYGQQYHVEEEQPRHGKQADAGRRPVPGQALYGGVQEVEATPHHQAEDDTNEYRLHRVPERPAQGYLHAQANGGAEQAGLDQPRQGGLQEHAFASHGTRIGPDSIPGPGFWTNGGFRRTSGDGIMAHEP